MASFSIDSWFVSWYLAKDVSTDREVSFGEFNEVSSVSFSFSAEILAEFISEDGTLIFSYSNLFV